MMWGKTRYFKKNILLAFFYLLSIVYYICAYTRDISIDDYLMRIHYITLISNNIIIYYLYRKYSIYKSIHKSIIVRLMKHKFEGYYGEMQLQMQACLLSQTISFSVRLMFSIFRIQF